MDNRPKWDHSEISEHNFRRIVDFGHITSVTAKWEMTGADTSTEWLVATNRAGKQMKMPHDWSHVLKFVGHSYVPGLFGLTYLGERCRKTLDEIDKWEAKNKRDRAEFERLKAKFAD